MPAGVAYHTANSYIGAYREHLKHTQEMARSGAMDAAHHDDDYEGIQDPLKWIWLAVLAMTISIITPVDY